MVITVTSFDNGVILWTLSGRIVSITFVLAPLGVGVDIHVDIALNSIRILTVG
jgi:hypothetical protein